MTPVRPTPAHLSLSPAQALNCWPDALPLAVLWSSGDAPAARGTILAQPGNTIPVHSDIAFDFRPQSPAAPIKTDDIPFIGGWIGWLAYDLGRAFEPSAQCATKPWNQTTSSNGVFYRCDNAWIHDALHHRWWAIGNPPDLPGASSPQSASPRPTAAPTFGPLTSETGQPQFLAATRRVLDYIRAGDTYQVNLAHRLSGPFNGSTRDLLRRWLPASGAWYGAYLEGPASTNHRATTLLSASPELFLAFDPATRRLSTRPMKGTRPAHAPHTELDLSPKDRAELTMIVDLMRNDLGRVCELGSVRVDSPRTIEHHAGLGVQQATAQVSGTLAPGLTWWDVIRATFPGGSVTGAPKVRAMQIIDELEPTRRGPYCGSIGYISDSGHFQFNIAIRTAVIEGIATSSPGVLRDGRLSYSVGAGIVADSDPQAEWNETMDKAAKFIEVCTTRELRAQASGAGEQVSR